MTVVSAAAIKRAKATLVKTAQPVKQIADLAYQHAAMENVSHLMSHVKIVPKIAELVVVMAYAKPLMVNPAPLAPPIAEPAHLIVETALATETKTVLPAL